jgi:hypothetical protein
LSSITFKAKQIVDLDARRMPLVGDVVYVLLHNDKPECFGAHMNLDKASYAMHHMAQQTRLIGFQDHSWKLMRGVIAHVGNKDIASPWTATLLVRMEECVTSDRG